MKPKRIRPMPPTHRGHAPDARYVHIIAKNRAEAVKRALIRQAMTRDGRPLATAPLTPPPPPTPLLTSDEADAARYNREREADKARQKANAQRALTEDADTLARWKGSKLATEGTNPPHIPAGEDCPPS